MDGLRNCTLVFLVKSQNEKLSEICLAMKKRGFGAGRWNGADGKVEEKESITDAAKREVQEEIGVTINDLKKVGELKFYFSNNPTLNQFVHVYLSEDWVGDVKESEEMKPNWFSVSEIPFNEMWPDDKFWLPKVIDGYLIRASFTFGEKDVIEESRVEIVESL